MNKHTVAFTVKNLLCEYAENPLGIDAKNPLFSWMMQHPGRGQFQTSYQILVSSDRNNADRDIGDLWDSGRVVSNRSAGIPYSGSELKSGRTYYWKVRIWDAQDRESSYSETAVFEMGLLKPEDWKGSWIGFPGGNNGSSVLLRREFDLRKRVAKARAYVSGLGYYEFRMNGQKVGDHVLDPGVTDYSKRILYCTYDITDILKAGRNVAGVVLGNGWYGVPKALVQINIEFEDGTREEVSTKWDWGAGWHVSSGPIIQNSIYKGEVYDARLEKDGWNTGEYDFEKESRGVNGWTAASCVEAPVGKLVSQVMEPIRVVEEIEPVKVTVISDLVRVYDIGQNIAGWGKLEVRGKAGTIVKMRYAENIYDNGAVNQENLRTAGASDTYILKGKGIESYSPRFTYHGFKFIQVELECGIAEVLKITAQVVRSSVKATGSFKCNNSMINQIYRNVWWTEASNLHSIPTDCPQRDERMAWLNDATARAEEAIYNFDMSRFYQKWMEDISDTQDEITGAIADTAPYRWGFKPADPVVSCYLSIPFMLYKHYGNKRVLKQHYEGLKKWVRYLEYESEDFIVRRSYYGDWVPPVIECKRENGGDGAISEGTPGELISTAYFYLDAVLISEIADILEEFDDKQLFSKLAGKIKEAFNKDFFDERTNNYFKGSQGSNSIALRFGLAPGDRISKVVENLVIDIEKLHDYHLSTGNQCTKHMLEVLALYGRVETAYKIVTQTTYPSWGFMIANGATTIWERWEYDKGNAMNSRNHPMHANVGSWFYKVLAGIELDESACGFDSMIIKPYPAGDLSFVNASLETVKGLVEVNWVREKGFFVLNVSIPANCQAKVFLPNLSENNANVIITESNKIIWAENVFTGEVDGIYNGVKNNSFFEFEIGSGIYRFTIERQQEVPK